MKTARTYEARLYVGNREGYDGPEFGRERVVQAVRDFQRLSEENVACVRITPCCYVAGQDYLEEGWELAVIQYPRFERPESELDAMMSRLQDHMLRSLRQNRVGLVLPDLTHLQEADQAQEHPPLKTEMVGRLALRQERWDLLLDAFGGLNKVLRDRTGKELDRLSLGRALEAAGSRESDQKDGRWLLRPLVHPNKTFCLSVYPDGTLRAHYSE